MRLRRTLEAVTAALAKLLFIVTSLNLVKMFERCMKIRIASHSFERLAKFEVRLEMSAYVEQRANKQLHSKSKSDKDSKLPKGRDMAGRHTPDAVLVSTRSIMEGTRLVPFRMRDKKGLLAS
jgi:hypothetical protein